MNKLLNSAMMPVEGTYRLTRLTEEEFVKRLQAMPFQSFIGYRDTARFIEEISGLKIQISRDQTIVQDGDNLLICRLKYRLQNPSLKDKFQPSHEDFEFFLCHYEDNYD